ncbi:hypothetical protein PILCRDRAFT_810090 [Piloderma croceum F 1598]|uniref:Uncharacterized protein n=1 Tax=Piloderma croceum (strain F 1598) TaxID=765440 RepID=A0A0C3GNF7_PILCF|nr:hypothetical protein PILCRDRAFT_810090 [Piloderma croceum F 1598]
MVHNSLRVNRPYFGVHIPKTYTTTSTPYTDRLLASLSCLNLFLLLRVSTILFSRSLTDYRSRSRTQAPKLVRGAVGGAPRCVAVEISEFVPKLQQEDGDGEDEKPPNDDPRR